MSQWQRVLASLLLLACVLPAHARFYRSLPRHIRPVVLDPEEETMPVTAAPDLARHLAALRPDYAIANVAQVFRNFFEKRPNSRPKPGFVLVADPDLGQA